ncbi:uncharacterized protein EV154DRAFT_510797, partial [Mucor mucedo]|uniref:uncharacterized protein n=1 Tax=Mucor mucedo TaxID=29922 RepID=UPI00222107E8
YGICDGTVRVWNTETLKCAYLIQSCHDVGDIFSVVCSDTTKKIYFGSQNTSIQWYDFADPQTHGSNTDISIVPNSPRKVGTINFFEDREGHDEEDRLQAESDRDVIKCVIREKKTYAVMHMTVIYIVYCMQRIFPTWKVKSLAVVPVMAMSRFGLSNPTASN